MNTRTRLVLSTALVAGAVALSGCSILQSFVQTSQPVRDAGTGEVTEQVDNGDVFSIRMGDCLNSTEGNGTEEELSSIPIVPCGEPHEDEVYSSFQLTGTDYPGEDAILDQVESTCLPDFDAFVGLEYEQSTLDFWPMYPTTMSWDQGDREVICAVYDPAGKVTGTLEGAKR